MNFLLAVVAFSMVYIVGVPGVAPDGPVQLAEVAAGQPRRSRPACRPATSIVSFNGQPVNVQTFREATQSHLDQPIQIDFQPRRPDAVDDPHAAREPTGRSGRHRHRPRGRPGSPEPADGSRAGIPADACARSAHAERAQDADRGHHRAQRRAPDRAGRHGAGDLGDGDYVADTGFWYPLFILTGLFSAGLSIANMLPIPALDGGRLFFVLLEWIRGRRIPPEREAAYHFVGIVVLLTLMVIISFNDLMLAAAGDQLGRRADAPWPITLLDWPPDAAEPRCFGVTALHASRFAYQRRRSREVQIGTVAVGGDAAHPRAVDDHHAHPGRRGDAGPDDPPGRGRLRDRAHHRADRRPTRRPSARSSAACARGHRRAAGRRHPLQPGRGAWKPPSTSRRCASTRATSPTRSSSACASTPTRTTPPRSRASRSASRRWC